MPPPDTLLSRPPRRWRWWHTALVLLLVLLIALGGGVWWVLSTNQTGNFICNAFANRLPGHLEVDRSEFVSLERLELSGVRLMERSGAVPVVTVERVVVTGELWRGNVDLIRVEGLRLDATAEAVRFLERLIKAENAIPGSGNPSLLKLAFTGTIRVDGESVAEANDVAVTARGPQVAVTASGHVGGEAVALQVATDGNGDQRTYRISLIEGRLPIWRLTDWLSQLQLLPKLPASTRPWVPEYADAAGTVVIADKEWRHFSGDAKARWNTGHGQAELAIDQRFVKLGKLSIRDDGLGSLDGQSLIDTDAHTVAVSASAWNPGPRVPIPKIVPTAAILQAMPRAQLDVTIADPLHLTLQLAGTGRATLTWSEGGQLQITGQAVALSLLQPFLPADLMLASGNATSLTANIDGNGFREASGTVEQARVLWQGWALGSLDGRIGLRLVPDGIDLDLALPALGKATWRAEPHGGRLNLDVTSAEALVVRLKGPEPLPELSGVIALDARLQRTDNGVLSDVSRLRMDEVNITDVLRRVDSELSGSVRLTPKRVEAHLLGRLTSGELRIPGGWRDLSKHRPKFNAQVSLSGSVLLAEQILVRATDATGEPLIDGYSAGMRGRFSLSEQTGTVIGVVDHADLGWLNTLVPNVDSVVSGEGAVTFTANLVRSGVESIEGHFLPLDAQLRLGQVLSATGIKGAVNFRIAKPTSGTRSP